MSFRVGDRLSEWMSASLEAQDQTRLLALAQAGDERAFRELIEPHRRALEVHAYRMLGSPQDAEDIVQETLMRAWSTLDRFERRSSISTWLYRIATNACLDELERRPRRPEPRVDPYPDERVAESSVPVVDPAARYAMAEGVELAFLTAIQRLPGRQRAILILRDVLGWMADEVAELLETTVAGVNSSLQRARAAIDGDLPAASRAAAAPSQRELLTAYVDAWTRTDMDALVELLREDAVLRMPPQESIIGNAAICEFFATGPCGGSDLVTHVAPGWANGRPAVVMHRDLPEGGVEPHGVLVFEVADGKIIGFDAYIAGHHAELFDADSA
jgi:RNA polymerase sigma-70 factor (ECF subfamily)